MNAYYNEIDPQKAAWLRELIKAGAIAHGEVDERSVTDVRGDDLRGFRQCHFFAGIGVWSYSLRLAGWPDDQPCWTGSCPCPSFSAAGKGAGFTDPRHLWPAWFRLIRECRPATVLGEQVAAAIRFGWLDLVATDLESADYAFGAAVLPAAGVGAPHIRDRVWFVAQSQRSRRRTVDDSGAGSHGLVAHAEHAVRWPEQQEHGDTHGRNRLGRSGGAGEWGDTPLRGLGMHGSASGNGGHAAQSGESLGMADAEHGRCEAGESLGQGPEATLPRSTDYWRNPIWIPCRDGRWRPLPRATESSVEPDTDELARDLGYVRIQGQRTIAPLIEKGKARVMRLRGYGDAINAEVAKAFIEAAQGD